MKLSYIVPIYNVEKYLRECVDSILSQTFDDYEIILVDDESPDNCPAICDEYAKAHPDIIKVIHQKNKGLAGARNTGLKIAQGDYIFFFDSDDYLVGDRINELYEKAVEYDLDVIETHFYSYNEKTGETTYSSPRFKKNCLLTHENIEEEICDATKKRMLVYVWKNLYKRSFLLENNIFFDEELRMIEDSPFNLTAYGKAQRFMSVDIPVYCYRLRAQSLQRQKYVKDYDLILCHQWELKCKIYEENFVAKLEFYYDLSEFIIKSMLIVLLSNIYTNKPKSRFKILKRIGNSKMLRTSFKYYDINQFKSKSLDWIAFWLIKNKLYFLAHIVCKILFK